MWYTNRYSDAAVAAAGGGTLLDGTSDVVCPVFEVDGDFWWNGSFVFVLFSFFCLSPGENDAVCVARVCNNVNINCENDAT